MVAAKKAKRKMEWIAAFFIIVMVLLFMIPIKQATALDVPAKASVLIDAETGKVLHAQNADEQLPPASTTKVMTALLVLEHLDLDDTITVPDDFVNDGEAGIWLEPGEKHTVEGLMMAMMLRSANDAAQVLAIGVAGSEEKFADMMNEKVKELGLKNTHFVNPNGLHDDNHYTSAYDLAMIAREDVKNADFNRIIVTKKYQLPWVVGEYDRVVYNRNNLLTMYPAADGIKNGYTRQAGSCLVSSATKDGIRLIGVVLNCNNMYQESQTMLEYGFDNYSRVNVCDAGEAKGEVQVVNGKKDKITVKTAAALNTMLAKDADKTFTEKIELPDSVEAPVYDGKVLGKITYTDVDGYEVSTDLIAEEPVSLHSFGLIWKQAWQSVWQVFIVPIIK